MAGDSPIIVLENEHIKVSDLRNGKSETHDKKKGEIQIVENSLIVQVLREMKNSNPVTSFQHNN